MKQPIFKGSGVAIVTPFIHESVDLAAMGRLLDFQLEGGTDAVIVCGTTGEASTMTYRERMRTIEFCVEPAPIIQNLLWLCPRMQSGPELMACCW